MKPQGMKLFRSAAEAVGAVALMCAGVLAGAASAQTAAELPGVSSVLQQARTGSPAGSSASGAPAVQAQALYYDPGTPPGAPPVVPTSVNCSVYDNIAPADLVSILRRQPMLIQACPELANSIPPADLADIMRNNPGVAVAPGFPPGVPPPPGAGGYELPTCPPNAMETYSADPALGMQYIGFRFQRGDGSTCSPWPTASIYYQDVVTQNVTVGGPNNAAQIQFNSPTFTVRWNFYSQPNSDPYYAQPPYNGYRYWYVTDKEYTGSNRQASASFQIQNRDQSPLYPWQSETFQLSYDGGSVQAAAVNAAYQYAFQTYGQQGQNGGQFTVVATPGARLLTRPDADGISAALVKTADGKSFQIVLKDQWASYYQGQQFEVQYQVKRDRFFGVADVLIFQGDATMTTAPQSTISLSGQSPKEALKSGSNYLVTFKFRRLGGTVSTADWMDGQNSSKVQF